MERNEKCWSVDNENFSDDYGTVVDQAISEGYTKIFEGTQVKQSPSYYMPSFADILDDIDQRAYDDGGEYSEGFTDVSEEAKEELDNLLKAWAEKYLTVDFYLVRNISEIKIENGS